MLCDWTLQELDQLHIGCEAAFWLQVFSWSKAASLSLAICSYLGTFHGDIHTEYLILVVKVILFGIQIKCFTLKTTLYLIVCRGTCRYLSFLFFFFFPLPNFKESLTIKFTKQLS